MRGGVESRLAERHPDGGFVVSFGVLLDTFVVRSVLVGALNLDVGRRLWWPSGLSRRPDVDLDELEDDPTAALSTC